MAKKSQSKGSGDKTNAGMSSTNHRKMAAELYAKARLHDAKADLADAKNPPKKPKYTGRGHLC